MSPGDSRLEVRETSREMENWHDEVRPVCHTANIYCLTYFSNPAQDILVHGAKVNQRGLVRREY